MKSYERLVALHSGTEYNLHVRYVVVPVEIDLDSARKTFNLTVKAAQFAEVVQYRTFYDYLKWLGGRDVTQEDITILEE